MNYIVTFSDNYDTQIIKITSEQKRLLDWIRANDYLVSWSEENEGEILIKNETEPIVTDLTI